MTIVSVSSYPLCNVQLVRLYINTNIDFLERTFHRKSFKITAGLLTFTYQESTISWTPDGLFGLSVTGHRQKLATILKFCHKLICILSCCQCLYYIKKKENPKHQIFLLLDRISFLEFLKGLISSKISLAPSEVLTSVS